MTSKLSPQAAMGAGRDTGALEKFPHFPPREDMENSIYLDEPASQAALTEHLGNYDAPIVLSEIPVRWTPNQPQGHRIPDLLVAFNINRDQAIHQKGYSILDQGKPPDFVLEVASESTGSTDIRKNGETTPTLAYRNTGGSIPLAVGATKRLSRATDWWKGAYQPVEIVELEPGHFHGRSDVLNLDLC